MDPFLVLINNLELVAVQVTHLCMTLAAAGLSDPHLTSGDGPDPEYLCSLWWYQEPRLSTQALAVVVSRTQTWPYIGPHITMAHGWHRPFRFVWSWCQHGPCTLSWTQVSDQTWIIHMSFNGYQNHGHQHRCWLLQGHEPRHDPGSRSGLVVIMSSGGNMATQINMAQRQHGFWTPKCPEVVAQTLGIPVTSVATWVIDISYVRIKDPDIALGSNPDPDITLVLGSK